MENPIPAQWNIPRWQQLPDIPLYMDQVIFVLEEALPAFAAGKEQVVTQAMVNNYVKHKLVAPPNKKKYGKSHIAMLVCVSVLKRALAMSEISALCQLLAQQYDEEQGYDLFCTRTEEALAAAFSGQGLPTGGENEAEQALCAAAAAVAGKLLVQHRLAGVAPQPE